MKLPSVDVIVPVYNEVNGIDDMLLRWHTELTRLRIRHRLIVVEDGSTDASHTRLLALRRRYPLVIDHKQSRRGYGAAVLDGIRRARAPHILHVDSDGQYDPSDIRKLWKRRDTSTIITGRRVPRNDSFLRKLCSNVFFAWYYVLFPSKVSDPSSPFVLYRRTAVLPHLSDLCYLHEGFWWGFTATATKRGLTRMEIPIRHYRRPEGTTKVYHVRHLVSIAIRNGFGLYRLRLAR